MLAVELIAALLRALLCAVVVGAACALLPGHWLIAGGIVALMSLAWSVLEERTP